MPRETRLRARVLALPLELMATLALRHLLSIGPYSVFVPARRGHYMSPAAPSDRNCFIVLFSLV